MDPALQELYAEGIPDDEVAVILRLSDPLAIPSGVRIVARFGHIATCRMKRGDIPRVRSQDLIQSMKAARKYTSTPILTESIHGEVMDELKEDVEIITPGPTDQRRPEGNLPTGRGVIVAHIDWGVDFAHPDFRMPDGRTRLLALWDQSSPYDYQHANPYGYGRIYFSDEINQALAAEDPYAALGYHPAASDPGSGSHGTHTLSISAGNGGQGSLNLNLTSETPAQSLITSNNFHSGPVGLAPEAHIVFVHLSTYTGEGPTQLGDSVTLLEGLDLIRRIAELAGNAHEITHKLLNSKEIIKREIKPLPFVVNASLGRQAGEHDGKTNTEQGMDAFLLEAPGRAIVQSAGNYFNRQIHACGVLRPGESRTLRLIIDLEDPTPNEVDLWYAGVDKFQIELHGPGGVSNVRAKAGEQASVIVEGREVGRLYHRIGDPNNGDNEVTVFLYRAAPPGEWELILKGEDIVDGRFHAWVERDANCSHCQARFAPDDSDPTVTTGSICNGLRTLAVGAYDAHKEDHSLGSFSSCGKTRDGRQKPDLVAPGVSVLAARSRPQFSGLNPPWLTRMSGTSMAAPHVTGTIALMFEAAGRLLSIEETRRILLVNTDPPPEDASPEDRLRIGSGYLNAAAAVKEAQQIRRPLADASVVASMISEKMIANSEEQNLSEKYGAVEVSSNEIANLGTVENTDTLRALAEGLTDLDKSNLSERCEPMSADSGEILKPELTETNDMAQEFMENPTISETVGEESESTINTEDYGVEDIRDQKKNVRDYRQNQSGAFVSPSPFQIQLPLTGGAPALAVPVGGSGSPLAFTVPLGGTPPAVSSLPTPPPSPSLSGSPTPSPLAEPIISEPAVIQPLTTVPPVTVTAPNISFYVPPAEVGMDAEFMGQPETCQGPWKYPGMSEADFGQQILASAEAAVESDTLPLSSAALLALLLSGTNTSNPSEAENYTNTFGSLGAKNSFPSATTLFNTFVNPNHPLSSRHALHRHYSRRFQVLAYPGEPLTNLSLQPGDLLLRIARGEGWGCVSVVAAPELHRYDRLGAAGLRGEGYPRIRPGLYVQVVEVSPRRQRLSDRFARQLCDDADMVLPDTLLLRARPVVLWGTETDEAVPNSDIQNERLSILRRGSTGSAVRVAQRKLNRIHADEVSLGLPGLNGCPLIEDGRFQERMETAVRSFQIQVFSDPIEWNGVIGSKTWLQLDLLTDGAEITETEGDTGANVFALLKKRSISIRIREIIRFVLHQNSSAGYFWSYSIEGPSNIVNVSSEEIGDDLPGKLLVGGSSNKLFTVTGLAPGSVKIKFVYGRERVDQKTEVLEITVYSANGVEAHESTVEYSDVDRSGPDYIRWVQSSLNQIIGSQLTVDGVIGPMTRSAIRSFQQQRGLIVDGIVGKQTEEALSLALTLDLVSPHSPVAAREQRNQYHHRQQRHHHPYRQPSAQPVPALPNLPANIAPSWVGVDKSQIPQTTGHHPIADPGWMGTLIDNSNLRFTGAYVTGPALVGHPPTDFTNSSKAVSRGWMANMQILTDQGWGAAFFYVGYSVTGGESAPSIGVDTVRGTLHGLHLRTTLNALGANFAGAVVFIDNEDSTSTTLPQNLIDYYNGLFAEMSRPDPNLAAFRPGLYGHGKPLKTMLQSRNDLFLWDVWLDTQTTNTPNPPFMPTVDPITVDPAIRPFKAYVVAPHGGQAFITWPIGRQFRFYTEKLPATGSVTASRLSHWRPIQTWDFDDSFVRDPAFPEGEPRLTVIARANQVLITARTFVPRGTGASPTPPTARLTALAPGGNTPILVEQTVALEPDAPSTLFEVGSNVCLCTVLNGGGLGIGSINVSSAWTAIDNIQGTVPPLRRIRVIAGLSRLPNESMLFMIGANNQLYVKRKKGANNWEDGVVVNSDLRLHPFTRLAATTRGGDTVDTFFIDDAGLLSTAFWARWFTTAWPSFLVQRIENIPSFLPGSDLAAVVPRRDDILIFGVGTDLHLRFAYFTNGQNWMPPASAGQSADLIGAHTRLSAVTIDDSHVKVAALTDAGQVVIYPFERSGTTWAAQPRVVIANPPALAGAIPVNAPGAVMQPADGFRINPFGDLALVCIPGAPAGILYCAGLRGGETKVLMRDLAGTGTWQFYV